MTGPDDARGTPSRMAGNHSPGARSDAFKEAYSLRRHPEGGWFSELYTSPFSERGRATAGSICFLLDRDEVSHFHRLDCDEIWYYHAGCGLAVTLLADGRQRRLRLGLDAAQGEQPMAVIPAGAISAAENLDKRGFTFVSCATTPKFSYEGFRLVSREELRRLYPRASEDVLRMAYEEARIKELQYRIVAKQKEGLFS